VTGGDVVFGIVILAGLFGVWMAIELASRQRIKRRRKAWRAGGNVGSEPGAPPAPQKKYCLGGEGRGRCSGGDASGDGIWSDVWSDWKDFRDLDGWGDEGD
jgi:hypothetical protein